MPDEEHYLVDGREFVITPQLYVCCDGGAGLLGHPLEYMTLERGGEVVCKYCGRRYVQDHQADAASLRSKGERIEA
jgi:uncharacterized Zn-finger protein